MEAMLQQVIYLNKSPEDLKSPPNAEDSEQVFRERAQERHDGHRSRLEKLGTM